MIDWQKVRRYWLTSFVQESNAGVTRISNELVRRANSADLAETEVFGLSELAPRGYDIAIPVIGSDHEPIAVMKLTLREEEPEVSGNIGVYFLNGLQQRRAERRYHNRIREASFKELTRIAFRECGLQRLKTFVSSEETAHRLFLESLGFVHTATKNVPETDPPVQFLELTKSLS